MFYEITHTVLEVWKNNKLGDVHLRNNVLSKIPRPRTAIVSVIKHRKNLITVSGHLRFADAVYCAVNNTSSSIYDINNNVSSEFFNSIVAKTFGGKKFQAIEEDVTNSGERISVTASIKKRRTLLAGWTIGLDAELETKVLLIVEEPTEVKTRLFVFVKFCKMKPSISCACHVKEIRYQIFKGNASTSWNLQKQPIAIAHFASERNVEVQSISLIMDEKFSSLLFTRLTGRRNGNHRDKMPSLCMNNFCIKSICYVVAWPPFGMTVQTIEKMVFFWKDKMLPNLEKITTAFFEKLLVCEWGFDIGNAAVLPRRIYAHQCRRSISRRWAGAPRTVVLFRIAPTLTWSLTLCRQPGGRGNYNILELGNIIIGIMKAGIVGGWKDPAGL
ncbi:hypothetical protein PR048_016033 [Dryococelus australis]|uniref:Uncharacterized protein n=1 Tax=Dryococelus australis TaxID=614101 RepID=A0ABQ9HIL1_9NEOP|nr:hypothetical protein PR048_016033 [Dryococelus australis]